MNKVSERYDLRDHTTLERLEKSELLALTELLRSLRFVDKSKNSEVDVRCLLLVCVNWIAGPTGKELHFRIGIILGKIHSCFPIFWNGSGEYPYLWVKKNSSSLDRAPKIRESVLINSWDSFLRTLLSISSETCVMYSWVIPGANVFCDWLFLVISCVSPETAVKIRLFF